MLQISVDYNSISSSWPNSEIWKSYGNLFFHNFFLKSLHFSPFPLWLPYSSPNWCPMRSPHCCQRLFPKCSSDQAVPSGKFLKRSSWPRGGVWGSQSFSRCYSPPQSFLLPTLPESSWLPPLTSSHREIHQTLYLTAGKYLYWITF